MNRRNRNESDGEEALLCSRPSTLVCPSPLEITDGAFNLATTCSTETGQTNITTTTILPFSDDLSTNTSPRSPPFIHPSTPVISHPPRLSVCRLTVLNKVYSDAIIDHIRVEAHQHDTIEDVIREICKVKQIRKKDSVRLLNYHGDELDMKSTLARSGLHDLAVVHLCSSDTCSEPELVEDVINHHQKQVLTPTYCRYLNKWIMLAVLLLILVICAAIAMICIYLFFVLQMNKPSTSSYAIVIDAGSTSSKIHLYSYKEQHRLRTTSPVTEEIGNCKTSSPLTDYSTDGKGENKVLDEIVSCLRDRFGSKVPVHRRQQTNIYLGATAGMRMLKHEKPVEAENIFNAIRSELVALGFRVVNPEERIRTISGNEEGLYAWITANYLKGTFGKKDGDVFQARRAPVTETYGALDLGGASTQIAFAVDLQNQSGVAESFINNLTLFDETYHVYSHSFLCFGREKVHGRIMALLLRDANFSQSVQHPCLLNGGTVEKSAKYIFSACNWGKLANHTTRMEIAPPSWVKWDTKFTFVGTGDEDKCRHYVKTLFPTKVCDYDRCSFLNIYQPPVRGKFLAFSSFYYTFKYLKLTPSCSLKRLKEGITSLCRTKVDQTRFEAMSHGGYYCLDGIYMMTLLQHYGFNESNWESIQYVNKIDSSAMSWTLGYMLYHTNFLPESMPNSAKYYLPFIVGTLACLLLLIVSIVLCYRGVRTASKTTVNAQEIHVILSES